MSHEEIMRDLQSPNENNRLDLVNVVRCKDCKFFSHGYCRFHDAKFVRPDGYCYWGERKDGEHHEKQL